MFVFRGMLMKRAYPIEEVRRMLMEAGWVEPRIETTPPRFEAWTTDGAPRGAPGCFSLRFCLPRRHI